MTVSLTGKQQEQLLELLTLRSQMIDENTAFTSIDDFINLQVNSYDWHRAYYINDLFDSVIAILDDCFNTGYYETDTLIEIATPIVDKVDKALKRNDELKELIEAIKLETIAEYVDGNPEYFDFL